MKPAQKIQLSCGVGVGKFILKTCDLDDFDKVMNEEIDIKINDFMTDGKEKELLDKFAKRGLKK